MRAPAQPAGGRHVLFDHFWVEAGDQPLPDQDAAGKSFVVTPSVQAHLRSLARAALIRRYPVLLQVRRSIARTPRCPRCHISCYASMAWSVARSFWCQGACEAIPLHGLVCLVRVHPMPMAFFFVPVEPEMHAMLISKQGVCLHQQLLQAAWLRAQGPTSSGKTSLVAHLAAATGHRFVRINNHEQTDLQVRARRVQQPPRSCFVRMNNHEQTNLQVRARRVQQPLRPNFYCKSGRQEQPQTLSPGP